VARTPGHDDHVGDDDDGDHVGDDDDEKVAVAAGVTMEVVVELHQRIRHHHHHYPGRGVVYHQ